MKKSFLVLAFILVACLSLSACRGVNVPPASPAVSNTETSVPTPTPIPVVTPEPSGEVETGYSYGDAEGLNAALEECYRYQIEQADKCRVKVGENEYYFDTSKYILMDYDTMDVEFPLYRDSKYNGTEFLGTIGYSFKVCEPYIYVESEVLWEDYPGRETVRIVNLNDLSVTPFDQDVIFYVPDAQGKKVYYNYEIGDCIYVADPSLKNPNKLHIKVPDRGIIEEKIGSGIDEVNEDIRITDVKGGWIYFKYDVFVYEGPSYYEGNYRIKTDGSKIEKIGEGKFEDEQDFKEG